jgi:hypothetical protein
LTAGPFTSSPSSFATATTIIHCLARGKNGHLQQYTMMASGVRGASSTATP